MSEADEILFKIDKANKMTFDCINHCYIYEDCDGNRITITEEEQRIINDYISPIKYIDWKKEKYPTKEAIWHFRADYKTETDRDYFLNNMITEIKHKFSDCNAVIILEKGKVIEVL